MIIQLLLRGGSTQCNPKNLVGFGVYFSGRFIPTNTPTTFLGFPVWGFVIRENACQQDMEEKAL